MGSKREQTPDIMGALISGGVGRNENPSPRKTEEAEPERAAPEPLDETAQEAEETVPDAQASHQTAERESSGRSTIVPAGDEYGDEPGDEQEAAQNSTERRPASGVEGSRSRNRKKRDQPTIEWEENSLRKNATFHLSTQVQDELESLYLSLRSEKRVKRSKSEILEAALRMALEDSKSNGENSSLIQRLKTM